MLISKGKAVKKLAHVIQIIEGLYILGELLNLISQPYHLFLLVAPELRPPFPAD